jgi:hypothetical protein
MNRLGFRDDTVQKVERGLFAKLQKNANSFQSIATEQVKGAFTLFSKPPILTGTSQKTTQARVLFGNKKAIIRFESINTGNYFQFPLLGKGTSAKYGERNVLKKGAENTGKLFKNL